MAKSTATKYRPERPILLNEQNTDSKSKIVTIYNIEQLRLLGWLCCYNELARPFHLSFDKVEEFHEFKRDCDRLRIKLKTSLVIESETLVETPIIAPEATNSYEDALGVMRSE